MDHVFANQGLEIHIFLFFSQLKTIASLNYLEIKKTNK